MPDPRRRAVPLEVAWALSHVWDWWMWDVPLGVSFRVHSMYFFVRDMEDHRHA